MAADQTARVVLAAAAEAAITASEMVYQAQPILAAVAGALAMILRGRDKFPDRVAAA